MLDEKLFTYPNDTRLLFGLSAPNTYPGDLQRAKHDKMQRLRMKVTRHASQWRTNITSPPHPDNPTARNHADMALLYWCGIHTVLAHKHAHTAFKYRTVVLLFLKSIAQIYCVYAVRVGRR